MKIDGKPARRPVAVEVATEPVNMTFTVRRPGILRGRIEDPAGIAIPWVNVNALSPGPLPPNYRGIGQTVGGVDGTFELRVDRLPVEVVVTAENRMFEPAYRLVRNHEDPLLFVGHPIRTDLRLEGRLVDQQSGEPLAPASVTLFTHCDETDLPAARQYRSFMQATVEVDSEGRFSLPCSNSCPMGLRFHPQRSGFVLNTRVEVPGGQCDSLGTVEVPRAGIVTVTVRDASGEPVPALRLRGFSSSPTTDGNGRFEVSWVEAGAHPISIDRLFVSADQADLVLVSNSETATHGREAVAVIEKPGDRLRLSLTAVLGGVLCLEPVDAQGSGLPITAIEVQHDNGIPVASATVPWQPRKGNRNRLCTRPLQAGAYRVQARGPGFVRSWWPGKREAADAMSIQLDAGQTVTLGQMVVEPAGSLDALLPGWVGAGQQELVWEIRPAETREQVAWTRHSPDCSGCRTRPGWVFDRGAGGPGMFWGINCRLTDLPIGTWDARAYRPGSDPADTAWRSVEPVPVRIGRVTHVAFEPAAVGAAR